MITQREFIKRFTEKTTIPFNGDLFVRSDDDIVEHLKKIILSCQTSNGIFAVKVKGFELIEGYTNVQETLKEYYSKNNNRNRKKGAADENQYNYINLKDSIIKILVVDYHLEAKGQEENLRVLIMIPEVVKKFYFYLNGNYYLPMYQIVDRSTYNSTSAKNEKDYITQKTNFQPINIYRHVYELNTSDGETVPATEFDCNIFKKTFPAALFLFARYGLTGALRELGLDKIFVFTSDDKFKDDPEILTFIPNTNTNIHINVPKSIYKNNQLVQHIVYTLCMRTDKNLSLNGLFDTEYWVGKLGETFSVANKLIKGHSILRSFESILDFNIQEQLRLPWTAKKDMFCVLMWMLKEYSSLRERDTLDVTKKKLRYGEYIAATYAKTLNSKIYRLSNNGNRVDIDYIRKNLDIQPDYLIKELTRSQLIAFRNAVTSVDSITALKFTYKGISGIGENKANSVSDSFRLLDISNMGILDPDASSASDPGISGSVVPMLKPAAHGYLSDEPEPMFWQDDFNALYEEYKKIKGLQELIEFKADVLGDEEAAKDVAMARIATEMATNVNSTLARIVEENE